MTPPEARRQMQDERRRPKGTRRRLITSQVAVTLCALSVLVALIPLGFILFFVVSKGIQALNWNFFTKLPVPVGEKGGGMANAIAGSLMLSGLGALGAIPIGIISGVYMAEYAGSRLASAVRFAADTLNGVPSIVIGVFVYGIAVLPFKQFTMIAGGIALGIMMIPIIARTTEELLRLVPHTLREGALALGATRGRAGPACRPPRNHHGGGAGAGAHCGRDRAVAFHVAEQPVLERGSETADGLAHRADFPVRQLAVRRLAPPGLGRRAGAGGHRALLFDPGARRHPPPGKNVRRQLATGTPTTEDPEEKQRAFFSKTLFVFPPSPLWF